MADADDWWARHRARQEQQRQYSERVAEYLVPALRFLGVKSASVAFEGYGDDGSFEPVVFENAPPAGVPEGMARLVEHACDHALPSAWEINAGSQGTWTINAKTGKAELDIEWNEDEDEDEDEDDEE